MTISREAVVYGYRFFLGRNPESEDVIKQKMELVDEESLVRVLIGSPEFKSKNKTHITPQSHKENLKKSNKKILLLGNCQMTVYEKIIKNSSSHIAEAIELTPSNIKKIQSSELDIGKKAKDANFIVIQPSTHQEKFITEIVQELPQKIKFIPNIVFQAQHPDMMYIHTKTREQISGFCGPYQSALIYFAYRQKYNIQKTLELFNRHSFKTLGYLNQLQTSINFLIEQGIKIKLPLHTLVQKWVKSGQFMHTLNHPSIIPLIDIAEAFMQRENISYNKSALRYTEDTLANGSAWGTYPEIAKNSGFKSDYFFKTSIANKNEYVGLEDFIEKSFETFSKYHDSLSYDFLETERFKNLAQFIQEKAPITVPITSSTESNPYQNLPDHQFWRRSIERVSMEDVDPVVKGSFTISPTDKVATAGSCFAQHISRTLSNNGFNYYIAETDAALTPEQARARNFGTFSARYGNLYTARQLLQLMMQAYGQFSPEEDHWLRSDGAYADPFRPQIEPEGFASLDQLRTSRQTHLAAVKTMFETLDIFVFTLGLTEAWRSKIDGAIFPLAPGVVAGSMDEEKYEFVNFETEEIIGDMQAFLDFLMTVNPKAKVILTVSPVPLVATYEDRHVLVSTTYSKSALRSAADALIRRNSHCDYFPSYEIITGNFNYGAYFEGDLRSVKEEGVNHVMRLFMQHYSSLNNTSSSTLNTEAKENQARLQKEIEKEIESNAQIICDEEALDPQC